MTPWLLLVLGVFSMASTASALVRIHRPAPFGFSIMLTSWWIGEWPLFHVGAQALVAAVLVGLDGLDDGPGQIGSALLIVSWLGLGIVRLVQNRARPTADAALRAGLGDDYLDRLDPVRRDGLRTRAPWSLVTRPGWNDRSGIVRDEIAYGELGHRHTLDVYRPEHEAGPCPVILQIHGGGWVVGHKRQQGMPLIHRLVANGYVAVSINYRLGPKHRFPEQLIDVKRAIAWTRLHVADHGGDPDVIILTGGSAGGHLAALAALTPNRPEYQPGFEDVDTAVAACMPFYGPTDFTDADQLRGRIDSYEIFLRRTVMPGPLRNAPELYRAMSPVSHVNPEAPPFFIVQGSLDVLVWREENRSFAQRLAAVSPAPVVYWEVPGAQHAFDTFNSQRSAAAVDACERFAGWVVARSVGQIPYHQSP